MTLENYVKLEPEKEKKLQFRPESYRLEPRNITDPKRQVVKTVNAAVLDVMIEDGAPVVKTFSTLSEKLATTLKVAHDNGTLYGRTVGITRSGEGFRTEYSVKLY